ncbi:MAG: Elongation factor G [Mycoplasmataceae bacterium]|nr:MAG: Elongation factor G [Mycoplasmataceae bacterium]
MSEEKRIELIRNIGVMAHIDAGKTTTSERILFLAGKIYKIGETHEGQSQLDWMDQEKERGITITSAATTVFWKDCQINIIDTPGHVDFTAEVERSLRVLDGAILVVDAQAGVEPQTETVWRQADKYETPRIVFLNKMDKTGADFFYSLKSVEDKLNASCLVVQLPIGSENDFQGVVDIISQKAFFFKLKDVEENFEIREVPDFLLDKLSSYRQLLVERVIEHDENLASKYLEGNSLTNEEIKYLVRKATITGKHFPVFCGTAFKNIGIKFLLDGVVDYLPSPLDCSETKAFSVKDSSQMVKIGDGDCAALAFKIMNDPFGKLTFLRVYSGKVLSNSYLYNSTKQKTERISRLLRMHANKREEIKEIAAGDIAVAVGLKNTNTGDTLCEENKQLLLETISFADPVISLAIEPKTKHDQDKISISLGKISEEDPTFRYYSDLETGQMIISGMGELHLDVIVERLKREYDVQVNVGKPEVAYRETIKNTVENEGKYIKQSGGHGQYGHVWIKFEPNPNKGFEFVDAIKGGVIPKEYINPVKEGLVESIASGLLLGYPMVDVKATLYDGSFHDVDSSELAFKIASSICFRESKSKLKIVLLEPVMKLEVVVPDEYYGDIINNIISRRGSIEDAEKHGNLYKIYAKSPLSEMAGYSTTLRSLTKGRGTYSMQLHAYEEVPEYITEELLKKKNLNKK